MVDLDERFQLVDGKAMMSVALGCLEAGDRSVWARVAI